MKYLMCLLALAFVQTAMAQDARLPDPTDPNFCQAVQQYASNTDMVSYNTVMRNMPDYRASKSLPRPLQTFQIVSYRGQTPVMVSCKIKGSSHIRAVHGEDKAGEQLFCPDVTSALREQTVAELLAAGEAGVADKVAAFVLDDNEPFMTGREYLADFELSYVGDDGAIHLRSHGLFHDFDSWTSWILPERVEGQVYCHLPTPAYMQALATGAMEPGTLMTTADDAQVAPE